MTKFQDPRSTAIAQQIDAINIEQPTFAIKACCYWGNPLEVHSTAAYPESGSVWFQWNNFTP
ncbi:hypothetical protein [Nostoc sp. WHI]|uniref:hypothetical protein n=1 Tax=Nostoc sp. WHI TaxID=2650611 RepID=UPI0018C7FFC2|nr:hypothetical protein [Nostoc sp. WHI]MBG1268323.1 hypothetical protein [Nostoc sp. WHI]MBG1268570.1 hypothetical protein [Nostoc sp. WHI]